MDWIVRANKVKFETMTMITVISPGQALEATSIRWEEMEQLTNQVPAHQATPKLRVLELYSGIGGMHYALKGEQRYLCLSG